MRKWLVLFSICLISAVYVHAQSQPYGVVDTADLKLKSCEFEKDANAMVLFDRAIIHHFQNGTTTILRHKRIKIFNSAAYNLGTLTFQENQFTQPVTDFKAEVVNLTGSKIEKTEINEGAIIKQMIDKKNVIKRIIFPAIKAGTIIEYSFTEHESGSKIPNWYFQGTLPVRYSECFYITPWGYKVRPQFNVHQAILKNTDTVVAMERIPSFKKEAYTNSYNSNLQQVAFIVVARNLSAQLLNKDSTWSQFGASLLFNYDYARQLQTPVSRENAIIEQAKNMTNEQKIAFVFSKVQERVDCENHETIFVHQPLSDVWLRKHGSATEINLLVCRLLTACGILTCPVTVNMDVDERITPQNSAFEYLNRTVAYVSGSNGRNYVLDASEKENKWDQIPIELLNTYGLYMNLRDMTAGLIFLEDKVPSKKMSFVDGVISSTGIVNGTCQINNFSYMKESASLLYNLVGKENYSDLITGGDHHMKISDLNFQNSEKDSLPLTETFAFTVDENTSDEKYIYINTNLLSEFRNNPFLVAERYSDIDFTYLKYYSIGGRFKLPVGFTVDALPKGVTLLMPDRSISFKRITDSSNGYINFHYTIDFKRSYFKISEYRQLRDFFKKMYELINEQIVLKKS